MQADRTLDEIGRQYGTDKSSLGHGYLASYERFFAELRERPLKILEVGVYGGASLATWAEYFPRATIVGVDIDPESVSFERERVRIELADQSNLEELTRIAVRHGPFDVILEDGSHRWEHQITSLRTLFPFLVPGGLYIAEDLHVNFPQHAAAYQGVASFSCVDYLKRLVELRVADGELDIDAVEDSFLRTYGRHVDSITFVKHACILRKGQMPTRPRPAPHLGILAAEPEKSLVRIRAHVGCLGDTAGSGTCVNPGEADRRKNIQGFLLLAPTLKEGTLQYRARLSDGSWTGWATPPRFVGTRGKELDLTGVELRLDAPAGSGYSLQVAAKFRDDDQVVLGGNERPCLPRTAGAALYALQIHVSA